MSSASNFGPLTLPDGTVLINPEILAPDAATNLISYDAATNTVIVGPGDTASGEVDLETGTGTVFSFNAFGVFVQLVGDPAPTKLIDKLGVYANDGSTMLDLSTLAARALSYTDSLGNQVVGGQRPAIADATGAGDVVARLNDLLGALRLHGLIAT